MPRTNFDFNRLRQAYENFIESSGIVSKIRDTVTSSGKFLKKIGIPMEMIFSIFDAVGAQHGYGTSRGDENEAVEKNTVSLFGEIPGEELVKMRRTQTEKVARRFKKKQFGKYVTAINNTPVLSRSEDRKVEGPVRIEPRKELIMERSIVPVGANNPFAQYITSVKKGPTISS